MESQKPNRVQFPILRKEDFGSDSGVAMLNLQFSQLATTINNILGDGGATQFPAGLDVQGSTVTGIASPSGPTDAVSQGHVSTNYGAQAQQPQLDIGGQHTLKGLAYVYGQVAPGGTQTTAIAAIQAILAPGISATVTLAKLTGGGTDGSMTFVKGILTAYTPPT